MNAPKQFAEYIDDETREHQERTASIRFKQSIIQGLGGPMVFGLVFAACGALFNLAFGARIASLIGGSAAVSASGSAAGAAAAASLTWPLVAIGVMFAIGVGCIYFGSKLNSELSRLEQNYGAKQIAKGINAKSPEIEQKPVPFASQSKAGELELADNSESTPPLADIPKPTVTAERALEDRVVPLDAAKSQATKDGKPATFSERFAANDEQPTQTHVRA